MAGIDYSVPEWLVPPSQAQERQLRIQEDAVKERAGMMLRKQIGLARMREEAATQISQGVDPLVARKNALYNNAHLLFADNPNAAVNILKNEELENSRQQALDQKAEYQFNLIQNAQDRLDQTIRNQDAVNKLAQEKKISADTAAEWKRMFDTEKEAHQNEVNILKANNSLFKTQSDIQSKNADLELKKAREERLSTKSEKAIGSADKTKVEDLRAQINEIHKKIAARTSQDPKFETTQEYMNLNRMANSFQRQINGILDSSTQTTTPKPTGRIKVKKPDGTIGTISPENLDEAIKAGWTEVK